MPGFTTTAPPTHQPGAGGSAEGLRPPRERRVAILGIRGVPAAHGGFETFAERLAPFLVQQGWQVTVYCQSGPTEPAHTDEWNGVERIHIPAPDSQVGTMKFDWWSIEDVVQRYPDALCLMLGYNTAVFAARLRMKGSRCVINMDGIEWARGKWGPVAKLWFWLNDWAGCWLGDHLIADHPQIGALLQTRTRADKISVIPYGADLIDSASTAPLEALGLEPGKFVTLIARPEPENSILEVVQAFSMHRRNVTLAVLGRYDPANPYHVQVQQAASNEVRFLGAIYDEPVVRSLRAHCLFYVHGHQVGGTNPSLVEAMGSGNAILAHDNRFNRWVAQGGAQYFGSVVECSDRISGLLQNPILLAHMREASRLRHDESFRWPTILSAYERMLDEQITLLHRARAAAAA